MMRVTALAALAIMMLTIAGCGEDGPTQPQFQGTEMILVSVKDTVNGIYTERIVALDPNDSLGPRPRYILDSARLYSYPRQGKLAYLVEEPGDIFKVFVADIDGKNKREVVRSSVLARAISYPVLSRDARKIVYATHDNRLMIHNIDGSDPGVLGNDAAFESIPDFSPDNSRIAFHGDNDSLYIVNLDGSNLRAVAGNAQNDIEGHSRVEWSPDGKKLLYVGTSPNGQVDIWVVNADGAPNPTRLTDDLGGDSHPTWSPDGSRIAWAAYPGDVFVMNADGSGRENITPNSGYDDSFPSWSPDGKRIIYTSRFKDPTFEAEVGLLKVHDFRDGQKATIVNNVLRGFWGKY